MPLNQEYAVVVKVDIGTTNWVWRRLYSEPTSNKLTVITAMHLNPAGTKVACYATKGPALVADKTSFIFAIDAASGFVASPMVKITSNSEFVAKDPGIVFENDKIYVALNSIAQNN